MKILKMYVNRNYRNAQYYCVFDETPEITYEQIGEDYIGSATDKDGNIVFSSYLRKKGDRGAFGGRELSLTMKDGSVHKIKDYWWDEGYYRGHGEFACIGAGTLEELQKRYVYCTYSINKETFQKMLDDYYSREKEYKYYEIEEWAKMQYTWYPVMIDGKAVKQLMVNDKGHFAYKLTKKRVHVRYTKCIFNKKRNKTFTINMFRYGYNNGTRFVKIERRLNDVYKESLNITENEAEKITRQFL